MRCAASQSLNSGGVCVSLTFWTVEVSSRHSWMILLLVEVKSWAFDRWVLGKKKKTAVSVAV